MPSVIDPNFRADWRSKSMRTRRFYALYMRWVVRLGYAFTVVGLTAIAYSFVHQVDQTVTTPAGEPGEIRGMVTEVRSPVPASEIVFLAKHSQPVTEGQLLLKYESPVTGPPSTGSIVASKNGYFYWNAEVHSNGFAAKDQLLGRVVDYSKVVVTAKVRGETVADARVGQTATISQIDTMKDGKTLLRLEAPPVGHISSRYLLADQTRQELTETLNGTQVHLHRDLHFEISSIENVEVEGIGRLDEQVAEGFDFDPSRDLRVQGSVESGKHLAKVQFTLDWTRKTPERDAVMLEVPKDLRVVIPPDRTGILRDIQPRIAIVQANVEAPGDSRLVPDDQPIDATVIERTFECVIDLGRPPEWLVRLLRRANEQGKVVRARVEVRTGSVSAALKLLRR